MFYQRFIVRFTLLIILAGLTLVWSASMKSIKELFIIFGLVIVFVVIALLLSRCYHPAPDESKIEATVKAVDDIWIGEEYVENIENDNSNEDEELGMDISSRGNSSKRQKVSPRSLSLRRGSGYMSTWSINEEALASEIAVRPYNRGLPLPLSSPDRAFNAPKQTPGGTMFGPNKPRPFTFDIEDGVMEVGAGAQGQSQSSSGRPVQGSKSSSYDAYSPRDDSRRGIVVHNESTWSIDEDAVDASQGANLRPLSDLPRPNQPFISPKVPKPNIFSQQTKFHSRSVELRAPSEDDVPGIDVGLQLAIQMDLEGSSLPSPKRSHGKPGLSPKPRASDPLARGNSSPGKAWSIGESTAGLLSRPTVPGVRVQHHEPTAESQGRPPRPNLSLSVKVAEADEEDDEDEEERKFQLSSLAELQLVSPRGPRNSNFGLSPKTPKGRPPSLPLTPKLASLRPTGLHVAPGDQQYAAGARDLPAITTSETDWMYSRGSDPSHANAGAAMRQQQAKKAQGTAEDDDDDDDPNASKLGLSLAELHLVSPRGARSPLGGSRSSKLPSRQDLNATGGSVDGPALQQETVLSASITPRLFTLGQPTAAESSSTVPERPAIATSELDWQYVRGTDPSLAHAAPLQHPQQLQSRSLSSTQGNFDLFDELMKAHREDVDYMDMLNYPGDSEDVNDPPTNTGTSESENPRLHQGAPITSSDDGAEQEFGFSFYSVASDVASAPNPLSSQHPEKEVPVTSSGEGTEQEFGFSFYSVSSDVASAPNPLSSQNTAMEAATTSSSAGIAERPSGSAKSSSSSIVKKETSPAPPLSKRVVSGRGNLTAAPAENVAGGSRTSSPAPSQRIAGGSGTSGRIAFGSRTSSPAPSKRVAGGSGTSSPAPSQRIAGGSRTSSPALSRASSASTKSRKMTSSSGLQDETSEVDSGRGSKDAKETTKGTARPSKPAGKK